MVSVAKQTSVDSIRVAISVVRNCHEYHLSTAACYLLGVAAGRYSSAAPFLANIEDRFPIRSEKAEPMTGIR